MFSFKITNNYTLEIEIHMLCCFMNISRQLCLCLFTVNRIIRIQYPRKNLYLYLLLLR